MNENVADMGFEVCRVMCLVKFLLFGKGVTGGCRMWHSMLLRNNLHNLVLLLSGGRGHELL